MESRQDMLCRINEVSFGINDLTLFLDTHPTDEQALDLFSQYHQERKTLLEKFESQFGPLTVDCANIDHSGQISTNSQYAGQKHFHWLDGPLPWEGGLV